MTQNVTPLRQQHDSDYNHKIIIIIKLYLYTDKSGTAARSLECTHIKIKNNDTLILEVVKENNNNIVKSNFKIIIKFKNTLIASHLPRITN